MSGEQKYSTHVIYVMDEIQKRSFYKKDGEPIELYVYMGVAHSDPKIPQPLEQEDIVRQLENSKAIKVMNNNDVIQKVEGKVNGKDISPFIFFLLEINEPIFSNIYKKHKDSIMLGVPLSVPKIASFDLKNSLLTVGGQEIKIQPETKEFYLCKAIFKNSTKHWGNDELMELSGEDPEMDDAKKIAKQFYDAYFRLNEKIERLTRVPKLVEYQNKKYFLNPKISKIAKK